MYPEEYTEEFDGTQADFDAMYNWDPETGEVKGAVMPQSRKTINPYS